MSTIDTSNIMNMYSEYATQTAKDTVASKLKSAATADYSKADDKELMDVCKQFESYFLEQCFKEMTKTVGTQEYSSSAMSTLVDYYKDATIQKISSDSTEQNSLGLAQMLYEQMKRNYNL